MTETPQPSIVGSLAEPPKAPQSGGGRLWLGIGAGVLLLVLVLVVGLSAARSNQPAAGSPSYTPPPPPRVVYQVTGSATSANLTLQTPTGTSQQSADVPLTNKTGSPGLIWESGFGWGDFLYLSAQNDGEYGSITCAITVNGVTVSENTSSGAYAIASCSGQV